MSDSEPRDHWAQLASELGAEVPEEAERRESVSQSEQSSSAGQTGQAETAAETASTGTSFPTAKPACQKPRGEKQQRAPTDWEALAMELGVQIRPEPKQEPSAQGHGERGLEPPEGGIRPSEYQRMGKQTGTQVAWTVEKTLGPLGRGIEELTTAVAQAKPATSPAPPAGQPEQRGPKRKKKRRPKLRSHELADQPQPAEATAMGPASQTAAAAATEAEEPSPPKSKRRRRRRGKRAGREAVAATTAASAAPGQPAPDAAEMAEPEDSQVESEVEPAEKERLPHRAIPSWEEVVGIIIAKNMEARAKSNPGGQGRPRNR